MEKRNLAIAILTTMIIIVLVLLVIQIREITMSPTKTELERCKTIQDNSQGTNLVFFSTKEQAQEYSDFLLNSEPYKNYKDSFNIFYIDDYVPTCELYQGIAILCYSKELVKKASSCKNDITFVIQEQPINIRSSSYMNVLSINTNHNKNVILHEFGHAFANLADEYVPATLPRTSKNCVGKCNKFGENTECFQGCSEDKYYRSINNGVMRTLSTNEYGDFNKQLILKQLNTQKNPMTGFAVVEETNCAQQEYLLIEGTYSENKIDIKEKSIEIGCVGKNGVGDFNYKLTTKDNQIYSEGFNPEFIFTDAEGKNQIDGSVLQSAKSFYLKLPIVTNAKFLNVNKGNQTLAQINLQDTYSRPCKI